MPGPAATLGSNHVCPMCTGTVPHVGGPISGPGAPNVLINNKPAALIGDMCVCVGPPDSIVQGSPSVMINGKPAVCLGDMTAHGGVIVVGEPNVLFTSNVPEPSVSLPPREIQKIEISAVDKIKSFVSGNNNAEAVEKQELLQNEAKKRGYLSDVDFSA